MNHTIKWNSENYLEYLLKSISNYEKTIEEARNGPEQLDSCRAEQTKHWFQQLRDCIQRDHPNSWVVRIDIYEDTDHTIERIEYQYDPDKPCYEMPSIVIYQRDLDGNHINPSDGTDVCSNPTRLNRTLQ